PRTILRRAPLLLSGGQSHSSFGRTAASAPLVPPPPATSLLVQGFPSPFPVAVPGSFSVTAKDALGNTASGYRGTVVFTSSDPQAVLPGNYTFTPSDAGTAFFTAVFDTAGTQSLSATDQASPSITGTSGIKDSREERR